MSQWAIVDDKGIVYQGDETSIKVIMNNLKEDRLDDDPHHEGDYRLVEIHEVTNSEELTDRQNENIKFVFSLTMEITKKITEQIKAGKIPDEWEGIEMRWLLRDRFDTHFGAEQKHRQKEFNNFCNVNNL